MNSYQLNPKSKNESTVTRFVQTTLYLRKECRREIVFHVLFKGLGAPDLLQP